MSKTEFRSSPLNFLVALALYLVLSTAAALSVPAFLTERVVLVDYTIDEFDWLWRITIYSVAVIGYVGLAIWLYYGSRPETAMRIERAISVWNLLLVAEVVLAALVSLILAVFLPFLGSVGAMLCLIAFGAITWVSFWVGSLFLSPHSVRYCPLGVR